MGSDRGFHLAFLTMAVLTTEVKRPILGALSVPKYLSQCFILKLGE